MNAIRFSMILSLVYATVVLPATAEEPQADKAASGLIYELKAGVSAHDVDHLWSRSRKEDGIDFIIEAVFGRPRIGFLAGTIRPNLGMSVNSQGDTSKLYAGFLWEVDSQAGLFLNLGLGLAVHNGELKSGDDDKKALGSRVLFRIPIELGYALTRHSRLSLAFDHMSNAYLAHPNPGMDTLGLRFGYRF